MVKFLVAHLWLILRCAAGAIALWLVGGTLVGLFSYWNLSWPVPAQVTEWKVLQVKEGVFSIQAHYAYAVEGKVYTGCTLFRTPTYLNGYAAAHALKDWQGLSWKAWLSPAHPETSSLQRSFPTKQLIHTVLACGVLLYFCFLQQIVRRVSIRRR